MDWMAKHNQPLTYEILTKLATDVLKKREGNSISNNLSRSWCKRFLKRHNMSQRKARTVERSRIASSASFPIIRDYFKLLENSYPASLDPSQIYSMDEVGWSQEQALQRPVLVRRGEKQATVQQVFVHNHITTAMTISASGKYLPPLLIFSKNIPTNIDLEPLPTGWCYASNNSGFMDSNIFAGWFEKVFLKNIGKEHPVVLIIDKASSHFSLEVLEKAQKNNITSFSLSDMCRNIQGARFKKYIKMQLYITWIHSK